MDTLGAIFSLVQSVPSGRGSPRPRDSDMGTHASHGPGGQGGGCAVLGRLGARPTTSGGPWGCSSPGSQARTLMRDRAGPGRAGRGGRTACDPSAVPLLQSCGGLGGGLEPVHAASLQHRRPPAEKETCHAGPNIARCGQATDPEFRPLIPWRRLTWRQPPHSLPGTSLQGAHPDRLPETQPRVQGLVSAQLRTSPSTHTLARRC